MPSRLPTDLDRLVLASAEVADACAIGAGAIDRDGAFPVEEFDRLHRAGLLAAPLRVDRGGAGLGHGPAGTRAMLGVLHHLGRGNLSVGRLYEGHVDALLLIQEAGEPGQVEALAADALAGRIFGVWNTEAADGVRFEPIGGGRYRLAGSKTFASGAGHVARPIVTGALPGGGRQMAVVPMDRVEARVDPSSWKPLGMRASASFRVDFAGVEVGADAMLGRPGAYLREPGFSGGSIRFAAVQLGGAEALFMATRDALRSFGRADDPYQRARLGRMAVAVESGRLWLRGAAEVAGRGDAGDDVDSEAIVTHAHMTRTAIEAIGLEILQLAEQSVGARGLLRPHPIERIVRDLTLYLRQPGLDAALAHVGRFVLDGEDLDRIWSRA